MQKFNGLSEQEIMDILKKIMTQEQMDDFLSKIFMAVSNKCPNKFERLIGTTSLYNLIIPATYKRNLVRSAWNILSKDDSDSALMDKIGYNHKSDRSNKIKINRSKISVDEFEEIASKYYKYFGATTAYEKISDEVMPKYVYRVGSKGKEYITEAYQLLTEQLDALEQYYTLNITGDELLEDNVRRSIKNVELNFEKIVDLLNHRKNEQGGILLLSPTRELTMKRDYQLMRTLSMYSDDATNNGYLSGYDSKSGFTKLIRKI